MEELKTKSDILEILESNYKFVLADRFEDEEHYQEVLAYDDEETNRSFDAGYIAGIKEAMSLVRLFRKSEQEPKHIRKWSRKCDATGEGMNEGWCWLDGDMYFKYEKDIKKFIRHNDDVIEYELKSAEKIQLDSEVDEEEWNVLMDIVEQDFYSLNDDELLTVAYVLNMVYWTQWHDDDDVQWFELENGQLIYNENN